MKESQTLVEQSIKTSKPPALKPPQRDIKTAILDLKPLIAQALPRHLTAERMIQMATNYVRQNPLIAKCTEQSLLGAIMQTSILGLEPIPALGQVYFVPYKANKGTRENPQWVDEVQFQLGYRGMLQLIHNSGCVKMIYAEAVYEGDFYEEERGLHPTLKHIPNHDRPDNAKLLRVYAVAHTLSGGEFFEVLEKKEIEALRKLNRAQKEQSNGAWATHYEEMAKAKVLKKLAKFLPVSAAVTRAFAANESIITEKSFSRDQSGIDIDAIEKIEDNEWVTEFDDTPSNP